MGRAEGEVVVEGTSNPYAAVEGGHIEEKMQGDPEHNVPGSNRTG